MMPRLAAATSSLLLRGLAVPVLLVACIAPPGIGGDRLPDLVVLADRSPGSPTDQVETALADLRAQLRRHGTSGALAIRDFGTVPSTAGPGNAGAPRELDETLWSALAQRDRRRGSALVVVSDGYGPMGDAEPALIAAHDMPATVYWWPVAHATPTVRLRSINAPASVGLGERVAIDVELLATRQLSAELIARAPGVRSSVQPLGLRPGEATVAHVELDAAHRGPMRVGLTVEAAGVEAPLAERELLIDVTGPARIAYFGREPGVLGQSLAAGGFEVDAIQPRRAPTASAVLTQYSLAVLDDIALHEAPEAFWTALVTVVREHGLGLIVLGGPGSFGAGEYRGSQLESILPVLSEPEELESPAAVVFVVDKSGSMGRSSLALDRLRHARAAVIETARTLPARDQAGLIVFDTEPRVLVPLQPARDAHAALAQPWPVSAGGGTLLSPALEAAASMLDATPGGQRVVILVTDGFLAGEPIDAIQARITALDLRLIVLGIGADANVAALERLTAATRGELLRVAEAAELPRLMRLGLQHLRSRVSLGRVVVSQRVAPPFLALRDESWPGVSGYAVTRTRPDATAYLTAESGDPLLAAWHAGSGRVVALTAGLGRWTPDWIAWPRWPDLAGGLAAWMDGWQGDPSLQLRVESEGPSLKFVLDVAVDRRWTNVATPALRVLAPSGRLLELVPAPAGPGRFSAEIARPDPGEYEITAIAGPARTRRVYLHPAGTMEARIGLHPTVRAWQEAGLVKPWPADGLAGIDKVAGDVAWTRRLLISLSLAMLVLALLIDYRGSLLRLRHAARRPAKTGASG